MGISLASLYVYLIFIGICIIFFFIFIFFGISAFALGGTLGSIINSILPIAAGGIAIKKDKNIKE